MFEGARRIALGIGGLWVVGFVAYNVLTEPHASMTYVVSWPGESFVKGEACGASDASEYTTAKTSNGKSIGIKLCFSAHEANDGRLLVPYAVMLSANSATPNPSDQFNPDAYLASKQPQAAKNYKLKEVDFDPFAKAAPKGADYEKMSDAEIVAIMGKPPNAPAAKPVQSNPWDKDPIVSDKGKFWEGDTLVSEPTKSDVAKRDDEPKAGKAQVKSKVVPKSDLTIELPTTLRYTMSTAYSNEVKRYTEAAAKRFTLQEGDMKEAEQRLWDALLAQWKQAIQFIAGGLAVLWLTVASIGWIVRGFMGVKRGKDFIEAD